MAAILDAIRKLVWFLKSTGKFSTVGSEYQPFEYWKHLNTELFEVWISNGPVFKWSVYGLCPMW